MKFRMLTNKKSKMNNFLKLKLNHLINYFHKEAIIFKTMQ